MKTISDVEGEKKYRRYVDEVGREIVGLTDSEKDMMDRLKRSVEAARAAEQKTAFDSYREIVRDLGGLE
jgi:hypothetical protein